MSSQVIFSLLVLGDPCQQDLDRALGKVVHLRLNGKIFFVHGAVPMLPGRGASSILCRQPLLIPC